MKKLALWIALAAATTATAAPAALADGWPVRTVTSTIQKHFAPGKASVSGVACTRPSNVLAKCSATAKVVKNGKAVRYRVFVTVHMPIDGGPSARVTGSKRLP